MSFLKVTTPKAGWLARREWPSGWTGKVTSLRASLLDALLEEVVRALWLGPWLTLYTARK